MTISKQYMVQVINLVMNRILFILILLLPLPNFAQKTESGKDHPRYEEINQLYKTALRSLRSDKQKAKELGQQLETVVEETGDSVMLRFLYNFKAYETFFDNDLEQAFYYGNKQLELAESSNDTLNIINSKGVLATFYGAADMPEQEVKISHEILLFQEDILRNESYTSIRYKTAAYQKYVTESNLGLSYRKLKKWELARKYTEQSKKYLIGNEERKHSLGVTEEVLISIYFNLGEDELALESYNKAMAIFTALQDTNYIALCYNAMGKEYKRKEDIQTAEEFLLKAKEIYDAVDFNIDPEVENLLMLGQLKLSQKKNKAAFNYAEKAWKEIPEGPFLYMQVEVLDLKWRALNNLGKHKEAIEHYQEWVAISDSIDKDNKEHQIITSELTYKFKQKETLDSLNLLGVQVNLINQELETEKANTRNFWVITTFSTLVIAAVIFILFAINRNRIIKKQKELIDREYEHLKEFTENASHEMQTPMAIMQSKLENLLKFQELNEEQIKEVSSVYGASQRMSQMNQSLLLLFRIENGQFDLDKELNISESINRYLDWFSELMANKNLQLRSTIEDNIMVKSHNMILDRIISNLLKNSVAHNVSGGFIEVNLTKEDLTISNSGQELDEDPKKLFERFFKSNTSTSGTGLGLAIVKRACDAHNWGIHYDYKEKIHRISITF